MYLMMKCNQLRAMGTMPGLKQTMPGQTLLIVEDHDILREGLQLLLETEGYRVAAAMHGQDALNQMENITPDLILSDISMPEIRGRGLPGQTDPTPRSDHNDPLAPGAQPTADAGAIAASLRSQPDHAGECHRAAR
jgi:CheY-like chemotaxis protein